MIYINISLSIPICVYRYTPTVSAPLLEPSTVSPADATSSWWHHTGVDSADNTTPTPRKGAARRRRKIVRSPEEEEEMSQSQSEDVDEEEESEGSDNEIGSPSQELDFTLPSPPSKQNQGEESEKGNEEEFVELVQQRIIDCQKQAKEWRAR